MRIKPTPDQYPIAKKRDKIRYIGPEWTKDFAYQIRRKLSQNPRDLILDISQIDFISLFEWIGVIAYFESLLNNRQNISSVMIDAKGENDLQIVPIQYLIRYNKGEKIQFSPIEIKESERIFKILGFIESLGGLSVLKHPYTELGYLWIDTEWASSRAFYSRKPDDPRGPTVLFPMSRIESKEHCRAFVMDRPFGSWREAMAEKFRKASVFWSEEFWRVICYELSANIWEHSDITGFLSARVVEPYGV